MTYTVKYKLKGQWFWRTVKRVKGDLVAKDLGVPMRVLVCENETRLELPVEGGQFWFGTERFLVIKQSMEQDARQPLAVNSGVRG